VLLSTGVCYNCEKSGHCANECKKKNDGQGTKNKKFLGKCSNCRLRGHTGKDFWEKEEKKNKRLAEWKKKSERGLTVNDTTKQELNIDGNPKMNSILNTHLFGLQMQVQQFTELHT
jgi:hypothetical protein